jgi:hypothetical protein
LKTKPKRIDLVPGNLTAPGEKLRYICINIKYSALKEVKFTILGIQIKWKKN